jgi:multidrug efflux system outer membrane protein
VRRVTALLILGLLQGCSFEPHFTRPNAAIPRSWPVGDAYLWQAEAALPSLSYRDVFKDPKLQAIIVEALANNQDLRQAVANIASARAQFHVQRAALFPQIDATASITREHVSNVGTTAGTTAPGSGGNSSGGSAGGGASQTGVSRTIDEIEAGTTAWEVDLFGRLRSLTHSAFDLYLGQEAAARAARLTLVAGVANAYLQLAADRSLLAIAIDTEKSAQITVDLTQARLNGGVAPRTDLRQAQTVLATAQADEANQRTLVAQDRNALELLVGAKVADDMLPSSIEAVAGLLGELPAGLDSAILLRRPDVVEAEYQLRGANARIGAARAAFLPRISLTGLAGLASGSLGSLFAGGAFAWTVEPSVTQPIFDAGANAGNLSYAKAQREFYLAGYQKAIQTAFREVADGLARRGTIGAQVAADLLNLNAAEDSYRLALARYRMGVDPYLNTLDAQRTLYAARITIANVQLIKAQNLVTLYQALGGDQLIENLPGTDAARRELEQVGRTTN